MSFSVVLALLCRCFLRQWWGLELRGAWQPVTCTLLVLSFSPHWQEAHVCGRTMLWAYGANQVSASAIWAHTFLPQMLETLIKVQSLTGPSQSVGELPYCNAPFLYHRWKHGGCTLQLPTASIRTAAAAGTQAPRGFFLQSPAASALFVLLPAPAASAFWVCLG